MTLTFSDLSGVQRSQSLRNKADQMTTRPSDQLTKRPHLCVLPSEGVGQKVIPIAVEVLRAVLPGLAIVEAEAGWETFQ
jgi:hypothetical protein